jgi:phosphate transport system protein
MLRQSPPAGHFFRRESNRHPHKCPFTLAWPKQWMLACCCLSIRPQPSISNCWKLSQRLSEMGGLVERQVVEAIAALTTGDCERANRLIAADAAIDDMQHAIEERAVETIARRQPVAIDLRQVVSILRIAHNLERIGDLAKNIGKRVSVIDRVYLPRRAMGGINHMVTLMLAQLRRVLDCFANRDAAGAIDVWARDHDVDRLYTSLFRELLSGDDERPGARPVIQGGQRAIGKRSLDAAFDSLMMHANLLPDSKERGCLTVREQHLRPLHPTHRFSSRPRNSCEFFNFLVGYRQLNRLPPSCHVGTPRLINHKRGIHQRVAGSIKAGFMESFV